MHKSEQLFLKLSAVDVVVSELETHDCVVLSETCY